MEVEKQLQGILKNHLPGSLTDEQLNIVEPGLTMVARKLISLPSPNKNVVKKILDGFPGIHGILAFQVDFTDTNQLLQELLERLKKKKK